MGIIYIIISLILFISVILIKKSDKEQNILFWIIVTAVATLSYNIICALILLVIKVKINLIILSLLNLVVSIPLIIKIVKGKNIQKYYIRIKDIIAFVIIFITIIAFAYKQYGFPLSIKYDTSDPTVHFSIAKEIYENKSLAWNGSMPGASLNTAILFEIFESIVSEQDFYCLFIIFDLLILYLIATMFYIGICNKEESISKSIITLIFSLLFLCGYPLNSVIFGFSYLTVGILMMLSILVMAPYIKNKELNNITLCIYMFLLNIGIFFSYYFFVPIMYASLGLYMLFDMIKNKKTKNILSIFTKQNIINVLVILILPTAIGFGYFILPGYLSTSLPISNAISMEGYIYKDLYSNFLYLAPFVLFFIIDRFKKEKNNMLNITFIITILFTIVLFQMAMRGVVSSYYFYKLYFLISILIMMMSTRVAHTFIDKKLDLYVYGYLTIYISIILVLLTGIDLKIHKEKEYLHPNNYLHIFVDIYNFNTKKIINEESILTVNQLKAIDFLLDKEDDESKIQTYGTLFQMMWSYNVAQITDTDDMVRFQLGTKLEVELDNWINNENKKYYICFDEIDKINKNSDSYDIIYEDEGSIILQKK